MEIKKEDFVRFHIVDTQFYALPMSYFKEEKEETDIKVKIDMEKLKEIIKEPTKEELAAITKTEKIAKLKEELEALEA